ncbi:MAG: site-2 protease family protein [Atopobiaceae bacterium]|jgi:Zn-dependent protease
MSVLLQFIPVIISVALVMFSALVHEVAHGYVAYRLGDPTAKEAGRLTLNPAKHLDPFGSVVLPLLLAISGGPIFAYAKPVPYNPYRLRNPKRDEVLVALAGPASNFLQALAAALVFRGLDIYIASNAALSYEVWSAGTGLYWVMLLLSRYAYVNLILMFFNLIPLPPLDGSKIIMPLLRGQARQTYYRIQAYSMPILLILLYLVPMVTAYDPLSTYFSATAGNLFTIMLGI